MQEVTKIIDYLHAKSSRELGDIHDKMLAKVEKLGLGIGKLLSKQAKSSTTLAMTQRENLCLRKEIEIHSQNQQGLSDMNSELEKERAQLLQRVKQVMMGKVENGEDIGGNIIGDGKEDIRRRVLHLSKQMTCTPEMEFCF